MTQIVILVTPDGQTTVQTTGFTGPACRQASRFLEQALGQPVAEQLTPEFHQTHTNEQQQHQRP